jgi:hypothetical protein
VFGLKIKPIAEVLLRYMSLNGIHVSGIDTGGNFNVKNAVKTLVLGWIILIPIAAVVWSYRQQQPMQHEVSTVFA